MRELQFYEKIWFIVLMLILFWPAGIACIIIRVLNSNNAVKAEAYYSDAHKAPSFRYVSAKKIAARRSGRTNNIWGVILIICGIILVAPTSGELVYSNIFVGGFLIVWGIYLILSASANRKKWDMYESFVNNRGNTPISMIAENMNKPENTVRVDLQNMINKGFFAGPNGDILSYIDGEYNLLVMMREGHPMEPLDEYAAKVKERKAAEAENARLKDKSENVRKIRKIRNELKDQVDKDTLGLVEASLDRIDGRLAEKPELKKMTSVRKLYDNFLPKTLDLANKLNDDQLNEETKAELRQMMNTCAEAFVNLEGKLNEREDIDTMVDIEVLKQNLEREGLLKSDFDIDIK